MNVKKTMILIKGEIKTPEIRFCQYNDSTQKWNITFYNGKTYFYGRFNVEELKDPTVLNPNMYRISREGHELFNIQALYEFQGKNDYYWHICFEDGSERDYHRSQLNIAESCLTQKQAGDVFEYIKQIAKLSELKNEETGKNILSNRFNKISFIEDDIALARYLNPSSKSKDRKEEYIPIFPFGCNNSQYQAVKNAMEKQISVIQGPPGTGKTQTILNIIANILLQGKTVQVVSNNNSATENVYEKLASEKYGLGFIVAALGNSANKKNFIESQNAAYPDMDSWVIDENLNITLESIKEESLQLKEIFDKQEELAGLRQQHSQLCTEMEYFRQYLEETDVNADAVKLKKNLSSKHWMSLWQECQMLSEEKNKLGILFILKSILQYGITSYRFYTQDMASIITTFQAMYYREKEKELSDKITALENDLENADKNLLNDMCSDSMLILKDKLAKKYSYRKERVIFEEDDLWKNPDMVLVEYPVILSTTFSSRNSLNADVVYDYVIMDEASQVDIATGALALSCAKNVVIVGDTKQLPNVVPEPTKVQAQAIFDSFRIKAGYCFTKSFLQSVLEIIPDVTKTLLREHYRCHPKIINFCNQKFYRGELIIMTEDKGEEDVLKAIKTAQGNHVRNHYSQRQIDVIRNEIIPKYVLDRKETGIIAPYRNQVEALLDAFKDIDAATVHKFQGKEKDTIIISTVDDEITDFVDDPYLINVAVSRAKKKLIVVVSGNEQPQDSNIADLIAYIQYNNFEVAESKIYSVFDYLYKQYTNERKVFLQNRKKISQYDSENLMYALLEEILAADQFACLDVLCHFPMNMLIKNPELLEEQECKYAIHPATHIDFLIYNRISKKPVLAIEVDGYAYHREGKVQASRDEMKNHILDLYGISWLRFQTNGSGEKQIIMDKLQELIS